MDILRAKAEYFRNAIGGFLIVFLVRTLVELSEAPGLLLIALGAVVFAVYTAKRTIRQLHVGHTVQIVAPVVLLFANVLHPAIDGFTFYEVLTTAGTFAGSVLGLGIVVHEVFRQIALSAALGPFRIKWYWVVVTAMLGSALGMLFGLLGSRFIITYEWLVDIASVFAYAFIIAELYYAEHSHRKGTWIWSLFGIAIGLLVVVIT